MTRRYQPWRTKPLPVRVPQAFRDLLAIWQPRLGLKHWGDIPMYVRKLNGGMAAEVRWATNYKGAALAFNEVWLNAEHRTRDDYEAVVVHELLHLVFADMDDTLEASLGLGTTFMHYGEKREALCDVFASLFIARYKRAR